MLSEIKGGSPCAPGKQVNSTTSRQARGKIGTALGVTEKAYMSLKQRQPRWSTAGAGQK